MYIYNLKQQSPIIQPSTFTARRHASAVYICRSFVSVCLSQVGVLLKG